MLPRPCESTARGAARGSLCAASRAVTLLRGAEWTSYPLPPIFHARRTVAKAPQAAEKTILFVIPSEARNLSSVQVLEKKERFLASLGMTKRVGTFSASASADPRFFPIDQNPHRLKSVLPKRSVRERAQGTV